MWNSELWEEQRDFCDRTEKQKENVFNLTMTQAVLTLGRQSATKLQFREGDFAMLNKKEWLEKGDYMDDKARRQTEPRGITVIRII